MTKNHKHDDKEEKDVRPKRWIGCPIEEEYFGVEDRKKTKMHRKMITAKDRSKYKKTDRDKQDVHDKDAADKMDRGNLLRGRILSIMSQGIVVQTSDGKSWDCLLRGILKKDKTQTKNLITVGDFVLFEKTSDTEGAIAYVEPRKSTLSRADNLLHRKEQLIAANIDQVLITASVVDPTLKPSLLDRYIIAARKGGMDPVIVINKIDLLADHEQEKFMYNEVLSAYALAGIPVISLSIKTGEGLDDLRNAMKDKVSVFSGQSGVGKTSLINLITGLDLRVGKTVERTKKGSHTTTSAQLIPLEFGGWCIDTPGIKSFGVWDLKREEIEGYFTEIHDIGVNCKYQDCSHMHEANCAVIEALEEGKISLIRYQSYYALIDSISQSHIKR